MSLVAPLLLALLVDAAPPEAAYSSRTVLFAVPDLVALGVSSEMAQNLTAVITAELGRYDGVRAISGREMTVLLGIERQKALVGCENDSCMSQIADALGAEKVLSGQIGLVEQSIVFTLQLTDVKNAVVEGRVVKVVPVGKNQIVDGVRAAVTQLMGKVSSRNQVPRLAVPAAVLGRLGERVVLDASRCYDPDGDPLQTEWRQIDGPPAMLEGPHEAAAVFVAAETGDYTFKVSVTDGRSTPVEQTVKVEVLRRHPFVIGLSAELFAPGNRIFLTDGMGNSFRNRTPYGPAIDLGLWLTDRWQLVGAIEGTTMHSFVNDEALETDATFDYFAVNILLGVRRYFPFEVFKLWAGAEFGSARLFFHLKQGLVTQDPGAQAMVAEMSGGGDLPLGERFGVLLKVGMRAQANTEKMPPFRQGISFQLAPGGFFWGFHGSLGVYLRL